MGGTKYRVKVFNRGKATARNVRLEYPDDDDLLIPNDVKGKFPLESLEPQSGVELIAAVHMGTQQKHTVRLLWSDDAKPANEKTVYLTL